MNRIFPRNTDSKHVHEKVLNIINQGNANQNRNETSSQPSEWWLSKEQEVTNAGEDTEKGNSCSLFMGMLIGETTVENRMEGPLKNLKQIPYDSAIALLSIFLKEVKTLTEKDLRTLKFMQHYNRGSQKGSRCERPHQVPGSALYPRSVTSESKHPASSPSLSQLNPFPLPSPTVYINRSQVQTLRGTGTLNHKWCNRWVRLAPYPDGFLDLAAPGWKKPSGCLPLNAATDPSFKERVSKIFTTSYQHVYIDTGL